jgi:CRISPR-associated endonuclease Csn1
MSNYILGLDIGSNSIGWAVVDGGEGPRIIAMGVRVFPEGVDRDTKGLEKSKNATRREARGARRMHQRRTQRKERLIKTLRRAGLLPKDNAELQSLWQRDPYGLRKKGLDEKLELNEFGRVLYHLGQRRGFKSNRKSAGKKDDGTVKKQAGELQARIDASGCRTIGEYFAGLDPDEQRIRGRYTFRTMYEKEFDFLWVKQAEFYPDTLDADLQKMIRDEIIFFQRPLKSAKNLIGDCELEPTDKRCPRADWYARRFRLLQDVNNLIIQNPDGTEEKLSADQRMVLLKELGERDKLEFEKVRKKLGLLETQKFNAEYRTGPNGKRVETIRGDAFAAAMRSKNALGPKAWEAMDEQRKMMLNEMLVELEDDDLARKLGSEYALTDKQVEAAMKVSLPQGYMSFSRKAIQKLLPFMEAGALTSDAIEQAGYRRQGPTQGDAVSTLPLPPDLRNPIVQKALYEVRKVVNAIVREYGKPGRVKIEMARDVQGSRRQREELHWKMRENEQRNDEARRRLREDIGISDPTRADVIKYKLWEECGKTCPYTGRQISQEALFGSNPEFQVEHILPYDRSLDDSYMNLTLCEVHENIHGKGNRTPFEAYSADAERYEQIKQRTRALPWPKRQKFLQQEISLDNHVSRELNDTRYICRETVAYLKQLGVHVRGTRGKITAELRHQWGLDAIFSELDVRRDDDHRRHAVDALVVAVTDNEQLRRLAVSKYAVAGPRFEAPWVSFRDEAREKVKGINVSHRVCRKISGSLHEETNYGPTGLKDEASQDVYVYRKKLEELTTPMVEKIVDPVVRDIVRQRLFAGGIDPDAADRRIPKEVWKEPLYMRHTTGDKEVQVKRVRIHDVKNNVILLADESGHAYRAVEPGRNHHVEVFEYTDGPKTGTREAEVVTMFEAVRRSRAGEAVVRRDRGPGNRFLCSLVINDLVMMPDKSGRMDLFRVQKMNARKQVYFRHHTAARIDNESTLIRRQAHLFNGYKVSVDPIGRIWRAND